MRINWVTAENATRVSIEQALDEAFVAVKSRYEGPITRPRTNLKADDWRWAAAQGMTAREAADYFGKTYYAAKTMEALHDDINFIKRKKK